MFFSKNGTWKAAHKGMANDLRLDETEAVLAAQEIDRLAGSHEAEDTMMAHGYAPRETEGEYDYGLE